MMRPWLKICERVAPAGENHRNASHWKLPFELLALCAGRDPRTKPGARTGASSGWRSDDSLRLELRARRSSAMVASSTAYYQRANGDLRHIVAGHLVSRPSFVAYPGDHTRLRHRSDDRFDETAARQSEFAQCALLSAGSGHRRGLRDIRCAGLAKDTRNRA